MARQKKTQSLRKWPADDIKRWPIEKIKPYERNPMGHDSYQIKMLAESIAKYGFTTPVLVDDDGVLIYGHGRYLAAQQLGLTELPVAVAEGWTVEEKSAYRIIDNQVARMATWDMPHLSAELKDLELRGYDLPTLGFGDEELKGFKLNGFLNDLVFEDVETSSAVQPGTRGVQLRFDMLPEDRDQVVSWLSVERDKLKLRTTAETLIAMAKKAAKK